LLLGNRCQTGKRLARAGIEARDIADREDVRMVWNRAVRQHLDGTVPRAPRAKPPCGRPGLRTGAPQYHLGVDALPRKDNSIGIDEGHRLTEAHVHTEGSESL